MPRSAAVAASLLLLLLSVTAAVHADDYPSTCLNSTPVPPSLVRSAGGYISLFMISVQMSKTPSLARRSSM